jgi:hypothetical protein
VFILARQRAAAPAHYKANRCCLFCRKHVLESAAWIGSATTAASGGLPAWVTIFVVEPCEDSVNSGFKRHLTSSLAHHIAQRAAMTDAQTTALFDCPVI